MLSVVLFVAYCTLRLVNLNAIQEVRQFNDTINYTRLASLPLRTLGFWRGSRPWTVPLFYKLLGNDPHWIAVFQCGLSLLCWGLLAVSVARAMRRQWLKPVACAVMLLFSLSADIILWDGTLLSDSISISLMALLTAAWFWLLEGWQWRKAILVAGVALLWVFARDTNAWVVLMTAGAAATAGAVWRAERRYLVLAALLVASFAAGDTSATVAHRWVSPLMNVLGRRILPSQEFTIRFASLGMPVTPALIERTGQLAWSDNRAFYRDPALQGFRDWLYARGKSSYVRFLLAHPLRTIQEPFRDPARLLSPKLDGYFPAGFSPILPSGLAELVYFKKRTRLWMVASGMVIVVAAVIAVWKRSAAWCLPLLLVALAYPHAAIAWHGDSIEVGRHALQAAVHFRLGVWIFVLLGADLLLTRWATVEVLAGAPRRGRHRGIPGRSEGRNVSVAMAP